jgi:hypothetical protein
MNKEQFVISRFKKILRESLQEKADSLMTKLNYDEETELYPENEFDYVEEEMNEGETCEQCGGEIKEGETCEQCGGKGEVMELGGMEDSHPKFGDKNLSKLTKKQMEDLLYGMEDEDEDDEEDYKPRKRNKRDDDKEFDFELDESWYSHDEYERMRNFGSEDELWAYQDKLVSGGEKEIAKKEGDDKEFDFELDLSEEELDEKLYGKQHKLDRNKNGRIDKEDFKMLRKQQDETEQLYEVQFDREIEEEETVEGKKYNVKESILYTESDLIELIENIVVEEKKKFKTSEPKGYKEYEKAHKADKKENDDYLKSLAKKMTDYLKPVSDDGSKYEMKETKKFPTENGGMKKGNRKKYTPSDAVDEYVDAFVDGSGMTGLVFNEIKPNDEWVEDLLKGSSRTGNAQVDKDGNALGNVVPSKVGDKFYDLYKNNLYGQEQQKASYKRQPQPIDQAGEHTESGSLKSKRGKKTAQSVLNKLEESVETKKDVKLNEEFDRIQLLMGYNRKTQ